MSDEEEKKDKKYKNDYQYSKETYYELIERGREGIEEMIEVAKASEHPRAYEVLATLIRAVGEQTDKVMDLNKKFDAINEDPKALPAPTEGTTNNIFMGSTSDLQRMMQKAIESEKGEVIEHESSTSRDSE